MDVFNFILVWKEYLAIGACILFLTYSSLRNWGRRYPYIGIDDNAAYKFTHKPKSGEEQCRIIIQELFRLPFVKTRREKWLRNEKTGRNLELDCYNANIITNIGRGLAFEFDGAQHTMFVPHFHGTQEGFLKSQQRDRLKEKLCRRAGVLLIRIPYDIVDKEEFIRRKVRENSLWHYII